MNNAESIHFEDLAESREFRRFFEIARELTGILVVLVSPDGSKRKVLYPVEIETSLCRLIHTSPAGYEACVASDRACIQKAVSQRKALFYYCHAGLVDIVVPVFVNDNHVATMICGQVLPEPPSEKGFRQLCQKVGHFHFPTEAMCKAYFNSPHCSAERIKSIIKLFVFFVEYFVEVSWRLKQMNQKEYLPVERGQRHIHEHFREPLKLAEIARAVSLSPAYFSTLFHRLTGMTVIACLQQTRINVAKELLNRSSERVTDIALDVGFNNLTHFDRVFYKQTGCSPREYRRKSAHSARVVK